MFFSRAHSSMEGSSRVVSQLTRIFYSWLGSMRAAGTLNSVIITLQACNRYHRSFCILFSILLFTTHQHAGMTIITNIVQYNIVIMIRRAHKIISPLSSLTERIVPTLLYSRTQNSTSGTLYPAAVPTDSHNISIVTSWSHPDAGHCRRLLGAADSQNLRWNFDCVSPPLELFSFHSFSDCSSAVIGCW